ncbi:MAG: hypothetical protein H6Q48_67 [Deltaproteobacteria bacterium]|nr:hypothetical protein [Deltaproteobacteria bacterium]
MFPFSGFTVQIIEVFAKPYELPIPGVDDVVPGFFSIHLLLIATVSSIAPEIKIGVDGFLISISPCLLLVFVLFVVFSNVYILIGIPPRVFEFTPFKFTQVVRISPIPLIEIFDELCDLFDIRDRLGDLGLFNKTRILDIANGCQDRDDGHDNQELNERKPRDLNAPARSEPLSHGTQHPSDSDAVKSGKSFLVFRHASLQSP